MPGRKIVLANNEVYHVFNRGVASQPVFLNKKSYERAINTIYYYRYIDLPLKYSHFIVQSKDTINKILNDLKNQNKILVEIYAYCLMPNHYHFLLKQKTNNGISKFISNFTNSYTRYINTKNDRSGPLFQGRFKATRIETEEQLLHVSRYIHLNPFTAFLIKDVKNLKDYTYSSYPEYLGKTKINFCHKNEILNHFKSKKDYQQFVFDQAGLQENLNKIVHLLLDSKDS